MDHDGYLGLFNYFFFLNYGSQSVSLHSANLITCKNPHFAHEIMQDEGFIYSMVNKVVICPRNPANEWREIL